MGPGCLRVALINSQGNASIASAIPTVKNPTQLAADSTHILLYKQPKMKCMLQTFMAMSVPTFKKDNPQSSIMWLPVQLPIFIACQASYPCQASPPPVHGSGMSVLISLQQTSYELSRTCVGRLRAATGCMSTSRQSWSSYDDEMVVAVMGRNTSLDV